MAKIRRTTQRAAAVDPRSLVLRVAHAFGIHVPVTALASREGQLTHVRWCLICGRRQ